MTEAKTDLEIELTLLEEVRHFFARLDELQEAGIIDYSNEQVNALNNALGHFYAGLLDSIESKSNSNK